MRTILHVITSLGGGGAERQLALYLQHRSNRWNHVVAYRTADLVLLREFKKARVRTVWLGSDGFLRQMIRLVRLGRAISATIVHTYLYDASILGRLAGRALRVPVVTSLVSTLDITERALSGAYRHPWKYRLNLLLERFTARWTWRFIAITETVKASAVQAVGIPAGRIRVIYRAVQFPGPVVGGEADQMQRRPSTSPRLTSIGRLVPEKGHDLLLRMLPRVMARWPGVRLQIAGEGPLRATLLRLAQSLGIVDHVEFLGYRADVDFLLAETDVFVYASWFEGFSLVIAEATAMAVPVVTVDLPVTRETATPASVILVPRDEEAFANAVLEVLGHPSEYRRAAMRDSTIVRDRFSLEKYVRGTESVYEEAPRRRSSASPLSSASLGFPSMQRGR